MNLPSNPQPKKKLTSTEKIIAFILYTPVILVGLLFLNGLFSGVIIQLFPKSNIATSIKQNLYSTGNQSNTKKNQNTNKSININPEKEWIYLNKSHTGYSLWIDKKGCIIVKDLRESDLQRLNSSIFEFKKAIELETGAGCVIFK